VSGERGVFQGTQGAGLFRGWVKEVTQWTVKVNESKLSNLIKIIFPTISEKCKTLKRKLSQTF